MNARISLQVHFMVRSACQVLRKNGTWDYDGYYVESADKFGNYSILPTLNLLIHGHELFFHLFRSLPFSFNNGL